MSILSLLYTLKHATLKQSPTIDKNFFLLTILYNINSIGSILVLGFGIIFFYLNFYRSLWLAVMPFITIHFLYVLLMPISTVIIGKLGTKSSLIISSIAFTLSMLPLTYFGNTQQLPLLIIWLFLYLIGKLFYHPCTIIIQGKYTSHQHRGFAFSLKQISLITIAILTPLVGGLISQSYGLTGLALLCGACYLTTLIPVIYMDNLHFQVNLKKLFGLIKNPQIHKLAKINLLYELQNITYVLWPLFIFLIIKENFTKLGIFFSLVAFVSIILIFLSGLIMDRQTNRINLMRYSFLGVAFAWILKVFAQHPVALAFSDMIHQLFIRLSDNVHEVVNFDLLTDHLSSSSWDETLIIREVLWNLSIVFSYLITVLIITQLGFQSAFLFAALISLAFLLIKK